MRQENLMLDELEAHRAGRARLFREYKALEAELESERLFADELRRRHGDTLETAERLREQVAWMVSRVEKQTQHAEEASLREQVLSNELHNSREQTATLKRTIRAQAERVRHLELQVARGDEERLGLHDAVLHAESAADQARVELRLARDDELSHCREALRRSEDRAAELEAQLAEAQACVQSMSLGASAFLHREHRTSATGSEAGREPRSRAAPLLNERSADSGGSGRRSSTGCSDGAVACSRARLCAAVRPAFVEKMQARSGGA